MTTTDLDFDETFTATTPAPSGDALTERQIAYIADLRARWQRAEDAIAQSQSRVPVRPAWVDPATRSEASAMIDKGVAALAAQVIDQALAAGLRLLCSRHGRALRQTTRTN